MADLEQLGEIAAVNAGLNVVVADGDVIAGYNGAAADNGRAIEFLTTAPYDENWRGRIAIGDSDAVVLSLLADAGMATVARLAPDQFAIIEPSLDGLEEEREEDPDEIPADFLEQIAAALRQPPADPTVMGSVEVPSGVLVLGDCYDAYSDQANAIKAHESAANGAVVELDDHLGSVAVRVSPGTYRVSRLVLDLSWYELGVAFVRRES